MKHNVSVVLKRSVLLGFDVWLFLLIGAVGIFTGIPSNFVGNANATAIWYSYYALVAVVLALEVLYLCIALTKGISSISIPITVVTVYGYLLEMTGTIKIVTALAVIVFPLHLIYLITMLSWRRKRADTTRKWGFNDPWISCRTDFMALILFTLHMWRMSRLG